jgi:Flp pilus assembly protein TadG
MAVIAPLLILLAMGMIDLGWALYTDISLHEAAQEGAMVAALYVPDETATERDDRIITVIENSLNEPDLTSAATTITHVCDDKSDGNDDFQITIAHDHGFLTPLGGLLGGTVTLTAEVNGEIFLGDCP